MAKTRQPGIAIGELAPRFELPDTEGNRHRLDDALSGPATVVVFTCNHCPYALAWHDRIASAARDYADRGVPFVAINSNDSKRYPADSYEAMRERVRKEDWPMPYLRDESQEVAATFGARVTPDLFVLDGEGRVRYRGAPDEDYSDPAQNAAWLRDALDDLLAGRDPARPETEPVGCSVKWK
jgi:peroxiredoxin